MTNGKSGVWEIEKNSGANALADENPVNDNHFEPLQGKAIEHGKLGARGSTPWFGDLPG